MRGRSFGICRCGKGIGKSAGGAGMPRALSPSTVRILTERGSEIIVGMTAPYTTKGSPDGVVT
ncbi:hypothetical protein GCM10029992_20560 [Glycomyces albus]